MIYISTSEGSEFVQGLTALKSLPPALIHQFQGWNDTKSIWARYIRLKCLEDISVQGKQDFKQRSIADLMHLLHSLLGLGAGWSLMFLLAQSTQNNFPTSHVLNPIFIVIYRYFISFIFHITLMLVWFGKVTKAWGFYSSGGECQRWHVCHLMWYSDLSGSGKQQVYVVNL